MFADLNPYAGKSGPEIKMAGRDTFSSLQFGSKRVLHPEQLSVIYRLLKSINKPVFQSMAMSLEHTETLSRYLAEHEKEVIGE